MPYMPISVTPKPRSGIVPIDLPVLLARAAPEMAVYARRPLWAGYPPMDGRLPFWKCPLAAILRLWRGDSPLAPFLGCPFFLRHPRHAFVWGCRLSFQACSTWRVEGAGFRVCYRSMLRYSVTSSCVRYSPLISPRYSWSLVSDTPTTRF
jgi:hypothetical protein